MSQLTPALLGCRLTACTGVKRVYRGLALGFILCLGAAAALAQSAQKSASAIGKVTPAQTITIALISLRGDPRYQSRTIEHHYLGHPSGRLLRAAELALQDGRLVLSADGLSLAMRDVLVPDSEALGAALQKLIGEGVRYWLLDLPAPLVTQSVQAAHGNALMFNVSARDDSLRGASCADNLFHVIPSDAMRSDALAQYVAARNWRKALVLEGTTPADQALAAAWRRAAKRYGIQTTATKTFKLSGNPPERDMANTRLLTGERGHDIVAVWDADGEFARTLPYATQWPRPVIGSNGLVALAWHPQWERNGGPQLSRRFRKSAQREMVAQDWAAWLSVKAIVRLLTSIETRAIGEQAAALSSAINIDGYKGPSLSFRAWDGQLRQPIFIAHADGVITAAPDDGVLHPTENMDTLGFDESEGLCKRQP